MAAMDFSGLDRCVDALASSNNTVRSRQRATFPKVKLTRALISKLDASVSILSQSLSDYPRMLRVLRSRRGYELLSEHEIHLAQLEVRREVEPQIRELISRAESGLEALQRTERGLHQKVRPACACHLFIPRGRDHRLLTLLSSPLAQSTLT